MNITEAAIEAASLALHCDACTDDEHDACDRSDWAREAEIALRAALPHLQPTIPNTAEALDALAERLGWLPVARPSGDLAARGRALTEDLALLTALNRLVALQPDDQRQADRIEQAAMLEAAQVPDDLVAVMCKIAARGKILTDDLVAIERAGIMIGIEVHKPERETAEDEIELGRIIIRQTLDDDGTGVAIGISDGLSWWDAIAMLSAASRSIDAIYEQGAGDE